MTLEFSTPFQSQELKMVEHVSSSSPSKTTLHVVFKKRLKVQEIQIFKSSQIKEEY